MADKEPRYRLWTESPLEGSRAAPPPVGSHPPSWGINTTKGRGRGKAATAAACGFTGEKELTTNPSPSGLKERPRERGDTGQSKLSPAEIPRSSRIARWNVSGPYPAPALLKLIRYPRPVLT